MQPAIRRNGRYDAEGAGEALPEFNPAGLKPHQRIRLLELAQRMTQMDPGTREDLFDTYNRLCQNLRWHPRLPEPSRRPRPLPGCPQPPLAQKKIPASAGLFFVCTSFRSNALCHGRRVYLRLPLNTHVRFSGIHLFDDRPSQSKSSILCLGSSKLSDTYLDAADSDQGRSVFRILKDVDLQINYLSF